MLPRKEPVPARTEGQPRVRDAIFAIEEPPSEIARAKQAQSARTPGTRQRCLRMRTALFSPEFLPLTLNELLQFVECGAVMAAHRVHKAGEDRARVAAIR